MSNTSVVLEILGGSIQTRSAILAAFSGRRLLLESPAFIDSGTLIKAEIDGRIILGKVVRSVAVGGRFEHWIEARHSFSRHWEPHPDWRAADAPASVLDSLSALNHRLAAASAAPSRPVPGPAAPIPTSRP